MKDPDEKLDALLSLAPHIPDAGFSDALMARLPSRGASLRVRVALLLTAALAACGVVALIPAARGLLAGLGVDLVVGFAVAPASLAAALAVIIVMLWGALAAATSEV